MDFIKNVKHSTSKKYTKLSTSTKPNHLSVVCCYPLNSSTNQIRERIGFPLPVIHKNGIKPIPQELDFTISLERAFINGSARLRPYINNSDYTCRNQLPNKGMS